MSFGERRAKGERNILAGWPGPKASSNARFDFSVPPSSFKSTTHGVLEYLVSVTVCAVTLVENGIFLG